MNSKTVPLWTYAGGKLSITWEELRTDAYKYLYLEVTSKYLTEAGQHYIYSNMRDYYLEYDLDLRQPDFSAWNKDDFKKFQKDESYLLDYWTCKLYRNADKFVKAEFIETRY